MRVTLEPAFVLHTRSFHETSLIVEVFSRTLGRVSLVAKGVRTQRSKYRGLLRPFTPLLMSWSGKSELMTLTGLECRSAPAVLTGVGLLSGLYLNELLLTLLPKSDDHPKLFITYEQTLNALTQPDHREKALRIFEKRLLQELGYGLLFHCEADAQRTPVLKDQYYKLIPRKGFIRCVSREASYPVFKGEHLLFLYNEALDTKEALQTSKSMMRILIADLLEGKSLKTRAFFGVYK